MFYERSLGFVGAVMMSCYAVFKPTAPGDGVMDVPGYFTTSTTVSAVKPARPRGDLFYYEPHTRI